MADQKQNAASFNKNQNVGSNNNVSKIDDEFPVMINDSQSALDAMFGS